MGDCNKRNKSDEEESTCVCVLFVGFEYECVFLFFTERTLLGTTYNNNILSSAALLKRVEQTLAQNFTCRINDFCFMTTHSYTYTHLHALSYTYTHSYTYIHTHTHTHTHIHTHTHTYTHTHSYNKHILLGTLKIQPSRLFVAYTKVKATCCQSWARFDNA
jgi:hypothetical protein